LSPLRLITAVAVAYVCCVAAQGARGADAKPNMTIQSFSQAKKLMRRVFAGHERTFYCACAYSGTTVDVQRCGYQPQKLSSGHDS
jgi:endonuclease I